MHKLKRLIEAIFVGLPALLLLIGLTTGSLGVTTVGVLIIAFLITLAVLVYREHWSAYAPLLLLGVFLVFDRGYFSGLTIPLGVLYIGIALINFFILYSRRKQQRAATEGTTKAQ